jgi:deoxyribose-phosphate aldolase
MSFDLASYIDHTVLKQTTTISDIDKVCVEASLENFAAVCIPPKYVHVAKKMLDGSRVKVATVVGFPLGYNAIDTKVAETLEVLGLGADEVDMVIDLGALKNGDWKHLEDEVEACLAPVYAAGKTIKVIVESGILTDNELLACCELYGKYEIDFLKTSTGFAEKGATVHAVTLMRANLPKRIGIKASGGIRTYKFAKELIEAGATRLGCSASMQIMKESRSEVQ